MPTFRLLGSSYGLTEAELKAAPSSLLAELAACAKADQAVDIGEWADQDAEAFQVTCCMIHELQVMFQSAESLYLAMYLQHWQPQPAAGVRDK